MPSYTIINNASEINLNNQWAPATKFNSKDRIVDEKGHKISSDYEGRRYRIIEKRERTFSNLERFERGLLGTIAVVCTLCFALFSKSIRNLFTKSKESIRFAVLAKSKQEEYSISEQELQQGISISVDTISKIQTCMKNILQWKEEGGVKLYSSQGNHRVFALDTAPGLIFKMKANKNCHTIGRDDSMKARYQTMINAQTVVRTHQLGLLDIPNAKLFTVKVEGEEHDIIAERRVDINPHESAQEQYFYDYAESLNETIRQLAVFICKTGYSDVEWRNNPVLNNSLDENGNRKIALIDIEEMDRPETGLFGGGWGRRGLVGCVTEEQGKIVETVAKQNGIRTESFVDARASRKAEIEDGRKLKEYYVSKNVTSGNEPIQKIDENLMVFSEHPGRVQELRKVTNDLVQAINDKISKTSSEESIKGRRYIYIDTNRGPFSRLDNRLIDESVDGNSYKTDEEYYNATYLGCVVKKLIELGAIYKLIKRNGHGYYLQA